MKNDMKIGKMNEDATQRALFKVIMHPDWIIFVWSTRIKIIEDLKKIPDEMNDPTIVYQTIEFVCMEDDITDIEMDI